MKTIDTLVEDVEALIKDRGGVDRTLIGLCGENIADMLHNRLNRPPRRSELTLSAVGTPCKKKLWHNVNEPERRAPLSGKVLLNFLYGDLVEELYLFLAEAAGHKVTNRQERVYVEGVGGSKDCHIDDVLVDVKSANGRSYQKFTQEGSLEFDDPFGYKDQLQSYLEGSKHDETLKETNVAAFWVINKERGGSCLYWIEGAEATGRDLRGEIRDTKLMLAKPEVPPRGYAPLADGKSGNMRLPFQCGYCDHKEHCWDYRTFLYSQGPRFLTHVAVQPKVAELIDDVWVQPKTDKVSKENF